MSVDPFLCTCSDRSNLSLYSPINWQKPHSSFPERKSWPRFWSSCKGGHVQEPKRVKMLEENIFKCHLSSSPWERGVANIPSIIYNVKLMQFFLTSNMISIFISAFCRARNVNWLIDQVRNMFFISCKILKSQNSWGVPHEIFSHTIHRINSCFCW